MFVFYAIFLTSDREGDVRLTKGSHAYTGQVQVFSNSTWINVCGEGWREDEMTVACTQLGYKPVKASTYPTGKI